MTKPKTNKGTDWARLTALTEDEIERMAEHDTDNPSSAAADWTDAIVGLPPLAAAIDPGVDHTGRQDKIFFSRAAKTTK